MKKLCLFLSFAVLNLAASQSVSAQNVATAPQTELLVSAAASTKDVMTAINAQYRRSYPSVRVRFNFGASGALQKQIEQGAPVDVFVSAAAKNMNELASQNLLEPGTIRTVASNRLVLIVPASSTRSSVRSFRDLARDDVRNVAIGDRKSVPAGKYAQQVLTRVGVWSRVLPKAVQGKDVRAVLTQVETGNVDAGIVYLSDAATSRKVRVVAVAPASSHQPIRYLAAVVKDSRNRNEARRFTAFLASPTAQAIWRKFRFTSR